MTEARRSQLATLVDAFGFDHDCVNWERLNRSLLHRSYRAEAELDEDNERLEFLGDSVIGLVCTEYILRERPDSDEGVLSKLKASLVSRTVLGQIGLDMELGKLMLLGAGEERTGGRERASILGSALEAVCGAFYLDFHWEELSGPIQRMIIIPALELADSNLIVDYKSQLQELTQKQFQRVPVYHVIGDTGPDHQKEFEVEVSVEGETKGRGQGRRKKQAENDAARDALEKMGVGNDSESK